MDRRRARKLRGPPLGQANHHFVAKTRVGGPPHGSNRRSLRPPFWGYLLISERPNWAACGSSGEYRALSYPLIANDLNAVTGISLRYHSSFVYYLDIVPSRHPHDCNLSWSQPALGSLRSAITAFSL